jgi:hypothetical protein
MYTFRKGACLGTTSSNMRPNLWPGASTCVIQGAIVMGLSTVCRMEALVVLLIKPKTANCKVPEFLIKVAMEDGTISTFT